MKWGDKAVLTIAPAQGATDLLPAERSWTVNLRGFHAGVKIAVTMDGKELAVDAVYDQVTHTVRFELPCVAITAETVITVSGDTLITENEDAKQKMFDIMLHAQTSELWKYNVWHNRATYLAHGGVGPEPGHGWDCDVTDDQKNIIAAMKEMEILSK